MSMTVPYKLPHYKPEEYQIMAEFLRRRILEGKWSFSVKLKPPERPLRPFETPFEYKIWQTLHSKRIDAICETPSYIWIIEVKDLVRSSAIGQLLVYRELYQEQYHPVKPIRLAIVAGEDDPQVRKVAMKLGIKVWVMDIPTRRKRILGI